MNALPFILTDMAALTVSPSSSTKEPVSFEPSDRGFVYAVARRIVGSADDAEDVTQEALLLAYRYRDSFRGTSRYRTWLYRIAATTALGHLRRQRRSRVRLEGETSVIDDAIDPAKSSETLIAEAEERALVHQALTELTPSYRAILLARASDTEAEVAKQLGLTVGNVKVRAHRARKQLRATLDRLALAA